MAREHEIARYAYYFGCFYAVLYFPLGIGLEFEPMSQNARFSLAPLTSNRLALGVLLLASGLVFSQTSFGQSSDRPNIVFIFTDDHCQQALSAYDPSRMTTPNMDRIAEQGMKFNRCYVTNAICGPSRAVIQTGKHRSPEWVHGERDNL